MAGEDEEDSSSRGWVKMMLVLAAAVEEARESEDQWYMKLEWDAVNVERIGVFGDLKLEDGEINEELVGVSA